MSIFEKMDEMIRKNNENPDNIEFKVGDDVIDVVSWKPKMKGGTNFKSHKLYERGRSRLEFKTSPFVKIMAIITFIIFVSVLYLYITDGVKHDIAEAMGIITFFAGLMFVISLLWYLIFSIPIIFDKSEGYFRKSKKSVRELGNVIDNKRYIKLSEIYAIQVLSEYIERVNRKSKSYYSYEINLVLKDATRVNVVDHGNKTSALRDSDKLSKFLGVPLWSNVERN